MGFRVSCRRRSRTPQACTQGQAVSGLWLVLDVSTWGGPVEEPECEFTSCLGPPRFDSLLLAHIQPLPFAKNSGLCLTSIQQHLHWVNTSIRGAASLCRGKLVVHREVLALWWAGENCELADCVLFCSCRQGEVSAFFLSP